MSEHNRAKPLYASTTPLLISMAIDAATEHFVTFEEAANYDSKRFTTHTIDKEVAEGLFNMLNNPDTSCLQNSDYVRHDISLILSKNGKCRLSISVYPAPDAPQVILADFIAASLRPNEGRPTLDVINGSGLTQESVTPQPDGSLCILAKSPAEQRRYFSAFMSSGKTLEAIERRPLLSKQRDVQVIRDRGVLEFTIPENAFAAYERKLKNQPTSPDQRPTYPCSALFNLVADAIHRDFGVHYMNDDRVFFGKSVQDVALTRLQWTDTPEDGAAHNIRATVSDKLSALYSAIENKHPTLSRDEISNVRNVLLLEQYVQGKSEEYLFIERENIFDRAVALTNTEYLVETAKTITPSDYHAALNGIMMEKEKALDKNVASVSHSASEPNR